MNNREFEQFVQENGNDILNFCKMHTMNVEYGNELYQDTMLKLLEKQGKLDSAQNVKAYALSVAIFLWKNKKKKYLKRNKIVCFRSLDEIMVNDSGGFGDEEVDSDLWPEEKELYLDSFTLDYNKQVGEDFWINIGNVVSNMYEIIWSEKDSIEEQAEAYNMLLSDIKINVTVMFEDGTQSSKTIGLEAKAVDKRPEKPCSAIEFFVKEL